MFRFPGRRVPFWLTEYYEHTEVQISSRAECTLLDDSLRALSFQKIEDTAENGQSKIFDVGLFGGLHVDRPHVHDSLSSRDLSDVWKFIKPIGHPQFLRLKLISTSGRNE